METTENKVGVMDKIRGGVGNPWVMVGIAFVVGVIIGLVVLGWWLWPVKWVNASSEHLAPTQKAEYLRMAIEAYSFTKDPAALKSRYLSLGEDARTILDTIQSQPGNLNPAILTEVTGLLIQPQAGTTPGTGVPVTPLPGETTTPTTKKTSPLLILIPILCVLVLVIAAIVIYLFILRPRTSSGSAPTPAQQAEAARRTATWTDYDAAGMEPPLVKFMSSYKSGDDLFDDLYNVDHPSGEWLGECGVEIADIVVEGSPKKVCAFDVWLYDKNDSETVTNVLMSNYAFNNADIYAKLKSKGEPCLADSGTTFNLETKTMRMIIRIADMGYGQAENLPLESYFDRVVLELAVWKK
jgi:hypothetical protein